MRTQPGRSSPVRSYELGGRTTRSTKAGGVTRSLVVAADVRRIAARGLAVVACAGLVFGDQLQVAGVVVAPPAKRSRPAVRARSGDAGLPVSDRVFERLQPLETAPLHEAEGPILIVHGEPPCPPREAARGARPARTRRSTLRCYYLRHPSCGRGWRRSVTRARVVRRRVRARSRDHHDRGLRRGCSSRQAGRGR
jgi:hypothetical protein